MKAILHLTLVLGLAAAGAGTAAAQSQVAAPAEMISIEAIAAADLSVLHRISLPVAMPSPDAGRDNPAAVEGDGPRPRDPAVARMQILLDQQGASPGVIDGYDGDNVRKAIIGFQTMSGLPPTGEIDAALVQALETGQPVVGHYIIVAEDGANVTGEVPEDYAEKAQFEFLGYASIAEALAERFHMDINLLVALNPQAAFAPGETIAVAMTGADRTGEVARIEADKTLRQVRAYDGQGMLLAVYPATIGSEDNPSPSGSYVVEVVAPMPNYTYNPAINFQQGDNTEVLVIPPGPNGPVGSMWIGLSKPTYGIHGTPEPSKIDKTGSHGCIRLTNWDAAELAAMVAPGVTVEFI